MSDPPSLKDVGIIELCQADSRPTLIFDLTTRTTPVLAPVFCNSSLSASSALLAQLLSGKEQDYFGDLHVGDHSEFVAWVTNPSDHERIPSIETPSYVYLGFAWARSTVRERWRIISGTRVQKTSSYNFSGKLVRSHSVVTEEETRISPLRGDSQEFRKHTRQRSRHDWTRSIPPTGISSHIKFVRDIDWSSTPIGPMNTWSPLLRCMAQMIMADPEPAALFWGESLTTIYNEAFITIAGQKHPALMGQHPAGEFAEVWHHFESILKTCFSSGKPAKEEDICLFFERRGFREETYISFTTIPLLDEDENVVGVYHTSHESTRTVIAERRMAMLLRIGHFTAMAQSRKDFWNQVLLALESNAKDMPFAVLYSVRGYSGSETSSMSSDLSTSCKSCVFEGSIGMSQEQHTLPFMFDLGHDTNGLEPAFRQALESEQPVLISAGDAAFEPFNPNYPPKGGLRGFGDPFKSAMICPLRPTNEKNVLGILVVGLNTRRPYDEDYKVFIDLLTRQLATSLASTLLYEDEIRRGRTAAQQAEVDQAHLSAELALRTEEIKRTEQRFTRLIKFAPVGVFIRNSAGQIIYCNDKWFDFTGHPQEQDGSIAREAVLEDAAVNCSNPYWEQLVVKKLPVTFETELPRSKNTQLRVNDEKVDESLWTLTSAYPELSADGSVLNVVGYVTDISQQKWAEAVQQKLVKDAVESRRQQENFIDMTSHEIRNPLSAIMHSADGIVTWLSDPQVKNVGSLDELLSNSIDAAQTILYCAQHQKNIVDDILTLSKLDSKLLLITPVEACPTTIVEHTLKMFEAQFSTFEIKCSFKNELENTNYGPIFLLDPSRLMQILINLITNAIKFTKNETRRSITIFLTASSTSPAISADNIEYVPIKSPSRFVEQTGNVFLQFSVTDTGCGLHAHEKELLFKKFSQASPRTHVQYGGSGLGLFICREIVELQGGQIGVFSTPRQGTTIAFYIKVQQPLPLFKGDFIPQAKLDDERTTEKIDVGLIAASITVPTVLPYVHDSRTSNPSTPKAVTIVTQTRVLHILIVEDNIVNQRVLSKQLSSRVSSLGIANHGEEALAHLRKTQVWKQKGEENITQDVSVILMDIEMPVMDGLTCTREIRRLQRAGLITRHIPIIAVTANARKEQITQIMNAGLDQVISKPFRVVDLMSLIHRTIDQLETS